MKKKLQLFSLILFITFLAPACKKSEQITVVPLAAEEKLNVSYGATNFNAADIYLPENRSDTTKVIVLIHGGFWAGGDKNELSEYAKYYQQRGFAVANMNYRLAGTPENYVHPAQMEDIHTVINYIRSKASEWHISTDKLGLVGVSSGAHLALLYSYAYDADNSVKTAISIAGPANLTDTRNTGEFQRAVVAKYLGTTPEQNPAVYQEASPIFHVSANTKPTLLIHGKMDNLVPYQQAVDLKAKLDQFNVENNLLSYDNLGHEDIINPQNAAEVLNSIQTWLNRYLR